MEHGLYRIPGTRVGGMVRHQQQGATAIQREVIPPPKRPATYYIIVSLTCPLPTPCCSSIWERKIPGGKFRSYNSVSHGSKNVVAKNTPAHFLVQTLPQQTAVHTVLPQTYTQSDWETARQCTTVAKQEYKLLLPLGTRAARCL